MKTVPLHGKKAAGRIARVDDADYDLVMRFRWNVWESRHSNGAVYGPYARLSLQLDGRKITLRMHTLVTGYALTDHINHDSLDNRQANLRPATDAQNGHNRRGSPGGASAYKGVAWHKYERKWMATIRTDGSQRTIGYFRSEEDAARAYDAEAVKERGEYALPNFLEVATPLAEDHWVAAWTAHAEQRHALLAKIAPYIPSTKEEWWARRVSRTCTCQECGKEFQARSTRPALRCSPQCHSRFRVRQQRTARSPGPT
jgi:hypothetical protein